MSEHEENNSILKGQALAWQSVHKLCRDLGANLPGTPLESVRSFILNLYDEKQRYDALMQLIDRLSSGEIDLLEEMKP
jgi:hypothetical protein